MTDEYIRKQDAIDDLHTQLMYRMGSDDMKRRLDDWVKTLPSADVVPVVHAYWRDTGSGQECSACKEIQYGYDTGRHYCANCGAKIDVRVEECG